MKSFALLAALPVAALAQSVALQGMLGHKALLIVDGAPPRMLAPGETFGNVKVLSTSGDEAVLEVNGSQVTLHVGEAPASVGSRAAAPGSGSRIVITAASGGHFVTDGRINGQQVHFMVDTGATAIAIPEAMAKAIGVPYKQGRMGMSGTANGTVPVWQVKLASVRVGDVEVREVDAIVLPTSMPFVLLGNSFLSRFQMKRDNDVMVLERRY